MTNASDRAQSAFVAHFGAAPDGVAFAPGRVNLIGDHVDYCDGLVLPMPLMLGTAIAWRARAGSEIRAVAADAGGETDCFQAGDLPGPHPDWRTYLRGMTAILHQDSAARITLDLAIAGDLPRGAGLSSSASLCVAIGRALVAGGIAAPIAAVDLAQAAQRTEHDFAEVLCGIMDQMAVACGVEGHAMLLDCRDLTWRNLALPSEWAVLVFPSGVTRGLVDGEYNLRRAQCENAAKALGVSSLRDATSAMLGAAILPPVERMRAAHVIGEIARISQAQHCFETGDLTGLGLCLNASHASLRDKFEVSHPKVDRLVEILQAAIGEAGGARMTGGGFGGAVVAVASAAETMRLRDIVAADFSREAAVQMMSIVSLGRCPVV